jgi:hypothetical protein
MLVVLEHVRIESVCVFESPFNVPVKNSCSDSYETIRLIGKMIPGY